MTLDLVETLSRLVAIPSVNPMGREMPGAECGEARLTKHLECWAADLGLPSWRQTVAPGRDNLVVRLDGRPEGSEPPGLLLLEAHQDTVPVDGMTVPPFTPEVRDGRLFGRGSCDVKGGMTAMLSAVARLAAERPSGMATVVMAATVNEEYGFSGARALRELWQPPQVEGPFPAPPDAVVVAEPTDLDVVVAHKGTVRWRLHALGRASHSADPERGDNAIYRMGRTLVALEQYASGVVGTLSGHDLVGRPSLSVGIIRGGISVNTVPDRCTIEIDRRLVPGDEPQAARQHAIDFLNQRLSDADLLEHDPPFIQGMPLSDAESRDLAASLGRVAADVAGRGRAKGVPFGTNAAFYAETGVPTVVFGPGSIRQAHTADEWIRLEQLEKAAETLYRFARGF